MLVATSDTNARGRQLLGLLLGSLFWGVVWWFGAHILGLDVTRCILKDLMFYFVVTVVLTLALMEFINGFPSDWPAILWFFFPLIALLITAVEAWIT